MSEKFRLDRKIGFQNTFNTKCINVIIDSIGPSIILRSILRIYHSSHRKSVMIYDPLTKSEEYSLCCFCPFVNHTTVCIA